MTLSLSQIVALIALMLIIRLLPKRLCVALIAVLTVWNWCH